MIMSQYINALKNVNFSDEDNVGEFLLSTQHLDWRPHPQPVVLGTENRYKYQLISCRSEWEVSSDIAENTEESEAAAEIRSTLANTKSPVQYVVTLGYLPMRCHISLQNPFNLVFRAYKHPIRHCTQHC
jgi:hypothetical protein